MGILVFFKFICCCSIYLRVVKNRKIYKGENLTRFMERLDELVNLGFSRDDEIKHLYFNSLDHMAECVRCVVDELEKKYDGADIRHANLILYEACINAYKYGGGKGDIFYSCNDGVFKAGVFDYGKGFNPDDVPDPTVGDNLYKDHGRGLLLIKFSSDKVVFNEKGNGIVMVKKIKNGQRN
jgi:serine/threonine-protein kinase RsbW